MNNEYVCDECHAIVYDHHLYCWGCGKKFNWKHHPNPKEKHFITIGFGGNTFQTSFSQDWNNIKSVIFTRRDCQK